VVGCGVVSRARFVVRFFVDSVRNNQLTSLPRSLDLATNLKVLDVSTNKLQFLNCNLSPLIFLKELGNTTHRDNARAHTHTHH
jgi:Leucine-rich repeat (LRR) protein